MHTETHRPTGRKRCCMMTCGESEKWSIILYHATGFLTAFPTSMSSSKLKCRRGMASYTLETSFFWAMFYFQPTQMHTKPVRDVFGQERGHAVCNRTARPGQKVWGGEEAKQSTLVYSWHMILLVYAKAAVMRSAFLTHSLRILCTSGRFINNIH